MRSQHSKRPPTFSFCRSCLLNYSPTQQAAQRLSVQVRFWGREGLGQRMSSRTVRLRDCFLHLRFPQATSSAQCMGLSESTWLSVYRADPHGFHDTPQAGDKTIEFLEEFASECKKLGVELFGLTHHEYTEIKQVAQPYQISWTHEGIDTWFFPCFVTACDRRT